MMYNLFLHSPSLNQVLSVLNNVYLINTMTYQMKTEKLMNCVYWWKIMLYSEIQYVLENKVLEKIFGPKTE